MAPIPVSQNRPRYWLKCALWPPVMVLLFVCLALANTEYFAKGCILPANGRENEKENDQAPYSFFSSGARYSLHSLSLGWSAAWCRQIAVHTSSHLLIRNDGIRRSCSFTKLMLGRHIAITLHYITCQRCWHVETWLLLWDLVVPLRMWLHHLGVGFGCAWCLAGSSAPMLSNGWVCNIQL